MTTHSGEGLALPGRLYEDPTSEVYAARSWTRAEVLREIGSAVGEGLPVLHMISLLESADAAPIVALGLDSIADGQAWLGRYGIKAWTDNHHDKRWLFHDYTIWHGWSLGVQAWESLDGAS